MGEFIADGMFRKTVVFTDQDTDRCGRVETGAILHQMEMIAGAHYDALGLGRATAVTHGCFWAVSRTELALYAPVPVEQALELETWTGKQGHGLFWRHYKLQSSGGTVFARGVSVWVLMDLTTRTLSRDRDWVTDKTVVSQPGELESSLRRPALPQPLPGRCTRTVEVSETDINGHLNNTMYPRWADALLPEEYAHRHRPRRLWIEYKKELPLGQTAVLEYLLDGDTLYLRGTADENESFILRCDYDPIAE